MNNELTQTHFTIDNLPVTSDHRFGQITHLKGKDPKQLMEYFPSYSTLTLWVRRNEANSTFEMGSQGLVKIDEQGMVVLHGQPTLMMMAAAQWHHMTWLRTDTRLDFFFNGEHCGATEVADLAFESGLSVSTQDGSVSLARPMFYPYLLSDVEVYADFSNGLPMVQQSFAQAQPINFALTHPDDGPFQGYPEDKLMIVDAMGAELIPQQLVLTNIHETSIQMIDLAGSEAGATHHHFELKFRNGVIGQIKESLQFGSVDGWHISRPIQNLEDRSWSVYFLCLKALEWKAGDSWTFPFAYRTADGALGERGTHVVLSYENLELVDVGSLKGDRTKQVDILNLSSNNAYIQKMSRQVTDTDSKINDMEQGASEDLKALRESMSSLKVEKGDVASEGYQSLKDKIGSYDVSKASKLVDVVSNINDRLTLLDTEVDDRSITTNKRLEDLEAGAPLVASFFAPQGLVCDMPNDLYIQLDNRLDRELTFGALGEITIKFPIGPGESDMVAAAANGGNIKVADAAKGHTEEMAVFKLPGMPFSAGETKRFLLSDLIPNSITGMVVVFVDVKGLTGYQTQELSISIQKRTRDLAPFVGGGNVGIGTNEQAPLQKLDVRGNAYVSGNVGIGTSDSSEKLEVVGNVKVSDTLRAENIHLQDSNADITWQNGKDLSLGTVNAPQNGRITNSTSGWSERMRLKSNGNVGIGTTSPSEKLEVNGNVRASGLVDWQNKNYYVNPASTSKVYKLSASTVSASTVYADKLQDREGLYIVPCGYSRMANLGLGTLTASKITSSSGGSSWNAIYANSNSGYSALKGVNSRSLGIYGECTGNSNAIKGQNNSRSYSTIYARNKQKKGGCFGSRSGDYAEYFRAHEENIPDGISVVLVDGKVRPAIAGEVPMGIISTSPIIVGNLPDEWSGKYLKDDFGQDLTEQVKVEKQVQKVKIEKSERQKTIIKTVKETAMELEVYQVNGQYRQRQVEKQVEREVEEALFEEVDLYNEEGTELLGKHLIPVMETIERQVPEYDEEGNPIMIGSGEYEMEDRPVLNPDYDPNKAYKPRSERPLWACVGLVGQLPLVKGQPTAPDWIKMYDLSEKVEMWFVK